MKISINSIGVIAAYERGYRASNGEVVSPNGTKLKLQIKEGYPSFNIKYRKSRKHWRVTVHRLVGYQKYGMHMFNGEELRHVDENKMNFSEENVVLGTHSQNMMDQPKHVRVSRAAHAAKSIRVHTDELIAAVRNDSANGLSYSQIMVKHGLRNKGHVSYIVNHNYITNLPESNKSSSSAPQAEDRSATLRSGAISNRDVAQEKEAHVSRT